MTTAASSIAADRPAHYRLSDETWALILKEYREGATAPFLSRKWRVSVHAIRKRATRHGSTKRDWGDAQAIGQAVAREAELEEARRNAPEAVAGRLFAGVDLGDDEGDAGVLAQTALLASGRAMKGRLWAEAKALAGLAESYRRLETRQAAGGAARYTLTDVLQAIDAPDTIREALSEDPLWHVWGQARWNELEEKSRRRVDEIEDRVSKARSWGQRVGRATMRLRHGLPDDETDADPDHRA